MSQDRTYRPLDPVPDLKLYAHLSEKERMIQGFPYKPADPELCEGRTRVRKLCKEFNSLGPDEEETRQKLLKEMLHPDCHDRKIYVEPNFRLDYGYNLKLGNNFMVNYDCCILDCSTVEIGENCLMAPAVQIYTATHPLNAKYRMDNSDYYELAKPVKIGNNCWLGGSCVICPGVTIGDNVVVGAGSVVVKDVPSNVVVAGNPAKIIRTMDPPK